MSESGKVPHAATSILLVLAIFIAAFGVSCGGTFMFFVTSYGSVNGAYWLIPAFSIVLGLLGPVGFCSFFFWKLGKSKWLRWLAEFLGIMAATWMSLIAVSIVGSEYFGYEFAQDHPALYNTISTLLVLWGIVAIFVLIWFFGMRYWKLRCERIAELESAKES